MPGEGIAPSGAAEAPEVMGCERAAAVLLSRFLGKATEVSMHKVAIGFTVLALMAFTGSNA